MYEMIFSRVIEADDAAQNQVKNQWQN